MKMSSPNAVLMEPRRMRLNSLDTWRGLVIFIMMLDHVRDFFNRGAMMSTPTEVGHTMVLLYGTRWITHLCAPTFLFLAGVGIRLQYEKAGPTRELSQFLATRGMWLAFLDFAVVSTVLNFGRPFFFVQVLYATGLSMMAMAAMVWMRPSAVLVVGGAIVLLAPLAILPQLHATGAWHSL
ncbi:MAG TPA: heparan-alpha-glucosaminide N-acetyltransferase domain-containing protein [Edaphobacter sp.]|nr:heparan-alpha-glucosaminide N-acetyltransferase domain-containing protein [Edaphobacter sp.]